jgi:hypothetical protein
MKPLNCPNCGAALSARAAKNEITTCEFCGTSFRVPKSLTPEADMGDLLLGADFSHKVMPGWEVLNEDKLTFHGGSQPELRGMFPPKKEGAYYMLRSSGLMDDFDVSVSIKFSSGTKENIRAGIYPRLSDDGGYGFLISVQASYTFGFFEKDPNGGALAWRKLLPWTYHTALREGFNESNRLRVICNKDSFRVYINGVLAGSFKDSQYSVGRVYLTVDPGEKEHGRFAFSDLQLREVPG